MMDFNRERHELLEAIINIMEDDEMTAEGKVSLIEFILNRTEEKFVKELNS